MKKAKDTATYLKKAVLETTFRAALTTDARQPVHLVGVKKKSLNKTEISYKYIYKYKYINSDYISNLSMSFLIGKMR